MTAWDVLIGFALGAIVAGWGGYAAGYGLGKRAAARRLREQADRITALRVALKATARERMNSVEAVR